jgi:hypothetical protein
MLVSQGCGGKNDPTEPPNDGPIHRGNWIGRITGTHAGILLNGTCTLEMNLDLAYNGQWWVDCTGASSHGQVIGLPATNLVVLTLLTASPASNCPWNVIATATPSTIDGQFHVTDCGTPQREVGSGTITLRHR